MVQNLEKPDPISARRPHITLLLSTIEKYCCKVLLRKTLKVRKRSAALKTHWKRLIIKCNFSIAAISKLWESVMCIEDNMRNVPQGKGDK